MIVRGRDALYVLLACAAWMPVLVFSGRGLDLTDESFYLLTYAHPHDFSTAFSMFGVLGKPLYDLAGGSIAGTRILGAGLWAAVAAFAAWTTYRCVARRGATVRPLPLLALAVASGALYYHAWLLTPSYNLFALLGLALFWAGLLLWADAAHAIRATRGGAALIGCAAAVVFWAKMSSAALLPAFTLVALALCWRDWRRLLHPVTLVCGVAGLLAGMAIPLAYGFSPQEIVSALSRGVAHQQILKPGEYSSLPATLAQGIASFFTYIVANPYLVFVWLWLPSLLGVGWAARNGRTVERRSRYVRLAVSIGVIVNLVAVTIFFQNTVGYWALNVLLLLVAFSGVGRWATGEPIAPRPFALAVALVALVFVFAFGTSNAYHFQAGMAAFCLVLAGVVVLLPDDAAGVNRALAQAAAPALLVALAWLMHTQTLTPYRQDVAVAAMESPVTLRGGAERVLMSESFARYLAALQTLAADAGFAPDTPILDLTGRTPGVAYALGGRAYGQGWLLGGYVGSDAAAVYLLQTWDRAALESAWVLTAERGGETAISAAVLERVGLRFPEAYVRVGTVRRPADDEVQALWRPRGSPVQALDANEIKTAH